MSTENIDIYKDLDKVSKSIRNPAFEAYINLEGIFQGIDRFVSDSVNNLLKVISSKSLDKCIFCKLSLKKKTGSWDEAVLFLCEKTLMGIYGIFDGEEYNGAQALGSFSEKINAKEYSTAIIEYIELPKDFVKRRLKIEIPRPASTVKEDKGVKKELPKTIVANENIQYTPTSGTIPIETSVEKTKVLPSEELEKFYKAFIEKVVLPKRGVYVVSSEEKTLDKEKPLVNNVEELIKLETPLLKLVESLTPLVQANKMNITMMKISGDHKSILIEVNVSKLGLLMKKEKMHEIAKTVTEKAIEVINKNKHEGLTSVKEVRVTVKHGWDVIKMNKKV